MVTVLPPLFLSFAILSNSLPLSAHSRWILDEPSGDRVKLACVKWAAHLQPMLPEGLDKKPLSRIARHVALMGFNFVRLIWATYMFTRHGNLTVAKSLRDLGLREAMAGLEKNNPRVLGLTVVDAQKVVIDELTLHGVMVVLDNQVSRAMWCCGNRDGTGFFGDEYFDPNEWLQGLDMVARRFKDTPTLCFYVFVIDISNCKDNKFCMVLWKL